MKALLVMSRIILPFPLDIYWNWNLDIFGTLIAYYWTGFIKIDFNHYDSIEINDLHKNLMDLLDFFFLRIDSLNVISMKLNKIKQNIKNVTNSKKIKNKK